jgi:hypothetical protein
MTVFSHLRIATMRASPLLLTSFFALACAVDSTEPRPLPLQPRLAAVTAEPEFPNVVRFQLEFVVSIQDPEADLYAFAGLPDDPAQSAFCGGDDAFAVLDFQDAGIRKGAVHSWGKGSDVNLHVYQRSTFVDPCISSPIAAGKGRVMYVDNDAFLTGDAGVSWGFRMGGDVTLVGGGSAHLIAHNRFLIHPDGTFRRVFREVRLN